MQVKTESQFNSSQLTTNWLQKSYGGYVTPNHEVMTLDGGLEGKFVFNTADCIGKGAFARIFKGRNHQTYEEVAVKVEPLNSIKALKEYECYKILGARQKYHEVPGICEIYYMSNIGLRCMATAMELLGPSLHTLFKHCGKKFSLKTVLMIANQMITRLEYVHDQTLIHRDVKPENVLIGRPQQSSPYATASTEDTLYLIDFGLARQHVDPLTGMHILARNNVGMIGTYEFMSVNAHLNLEQSRRDDLESLGYMLVYFMNGTLPWLKYSNGKLDLDNCEKIKKNITLKSLCHSLPEEFLEYFVYVKSLAFTDEPDYEKLRTSFNFLYVRNQFPYDKLFDWSAVLEN